jgi:hypothetical protein
MIYDIFTAIILISAIVIAIIMIYKSFKAKKNKGKDCHDNCNCK